MMCGRSYLILSTFVCNRFAPYCAFENKYPEQLSHADGNSFVELLINVKDSCSVSDHFDLLSNCVEAFVELVIFTTVEYTEKWFKLFEMTCRNVICLG
ncbi:uncharacterized protein LOC113376715 isoform X2 [Ctenocephalides felis]|uniref:uncharacterized protein LOC113376715 isoform X2 n=1 Tax=Ctenocephalides felis TaxID=7515 RepID=UPI000E6E3714|nr:uncharacterized protein LOC113376715 isoform X2 [Ctenocephalides felis]